MRHLKLVGVAKLVLTFGLLILAPVWMGVGQQSLIRYQGEFPDGNSMVWGTWSTQEATHWINDGQYHILIEQVDCESWVVANGTEFASFRLDVDTAVTACPADNAYGVLFRFADEGSCYAFFVSSDGYIKLWKRLNGDWETIVPHKRCYSVNLGEASNHLTVVADGHHMRCYINGGKVIEVTDASLAYGRIGLVAAVGQYPGFQIAFDNVTVRTVQNQ